VPGRLDVVEPELEMRTAERTGDWPVVLEVVVVAVVAVVEIHHRSKERSVSEMDELERKAERTADWPVVLEVAVVVVAGERLEELERKAERTGDWPVVLEVVDVVVEIVVVEQLYSGRTAGPLDFQPHSRHRFWLECHCGFC